MQFKTSLREFHSRMAVMKAKEPLVSSYVWTYAAGFSQPGDTIFIYYCACATTPGTTAHMFIGDQYYCESRYVLPLSITRVFYTTDPLWDGSGCVDASTNCCIDADMP